MPRSALAPLALLLLTVPALAQDDPGTVGISVDGTVVEVPVETAAEACGIAAEDVLAEWAALGTEVATMADTSVGADATDLAPAVEVDTAMDATVDGVTVTDGADASHAEDGTAAEDVASDEGAADTDADGDADATAGADAAADAPATPVAGTALSKAALCEIGADTAAALAIEVPAQ